MSFLTPAEYHDLVLERLEADVIFSLDPLYKQLPLPVRTIPREELDAMSTFSCAKTYWADQRTKHRRARYSSEVQAARSRGKRLTDEHKRRLKEGSIAFWEQYNAWKAEQGKGDWKRNCPSCDKVLSYANHDTLQNAIKKKCEVPQLQGRLEAIGGVLSQDFRSQSKEDSQEVRARLYLPKAFARGLRETQTRFTGQAKEHKPTGKSTSRHCTPPQAQGSDVSRHLLMDSLFENGFSQFCCVS